MGIEIVVALLGAWMFQLGLSAWQIHRYYKRIGKLRRLGRCATGMAGGRYRGRAYAVVVVNPTSRLVTHAEQLAGVTVFAALKQEPRLIGHSLDDLLGDDEVLATLRPRTAAAYRAAARTLNDALTSGQPARTSPFVPGIA